MPCKAFGLYLVGSIMYVFIKNIYCLNKYLLSTYVSGSMLNTGGITVTKTKMLNVKAFIFYG